METCTVCGSWFVTDEPCEVCGNVVENVAARPPTLASDPRQRTATPDVPTDPVPTPAPPVAGIPDVTGSTIDRRKVTLLAVAAICAALLLIVPVVLLSGRGDDTAPETLAIVEGPEGSSVDVELETFCANPRPIAGVPNPDQDGANLFATYEKLGSLPWQQGLTGGMFDETYYAEEFPKLRVTTIAPNEPSYILCLSGLGDGRDRVCADYGTGGQFQIFGATWTMSLYELASGEPVVADAPIRSEVSVCPDIRPDLSRNQGPRAEYVRLLTVGYALPSDYTAMHLERDLDNGSTRWCDTPSRVLNIGDRATKPAVFLLTNGSQSLASAPAQVRTSTKDISLVTHIACLAFDRDPDERQIRCRFEDQNLVKFDRGTYTVTVVEATTGLSVEEQSFDADVSCPEVFDFAHVRVHSLRGRLPADAASWIDSLMQSPVAEDEASDDDAEEEIQEEDPAS